MARLRGGSECTEGARRVILSACSPYFRAMFTGELAESRATEVTIRDVDEQAMEQLVEFCYTAHIVVEESNVQALLPAACLLQLQEIQDVCCEFLKRQLDCSNCLGIRAFADTHSCRELLRIADKFTQQNFPEVRVILHYILRDMFVASYSPYYYYIVTSYSLLYKMFFKSR